ncbi:MAG: hypothetical protein V9E89_08090 [Ilumatobacteraceae bacterium]
MNAALAAAATLVAAAFTLSTWDRWLRRRRSHELAWTISLATFTLGSAALWWAESTGWNLANFRLFYLAGAVLNVPWLALGTVYLLAGERRGRAVRGWLVGLSGLAAGVVLTAPTRTPVNGNEMPTGKDVFGVAPRVLAALGSGVAALVIIGGALWSAWRVWRATAPAVAGHTRAGATNRRLVAGNLLIAGGTLILSASGTLAGRLGKDRAFAITLTAGIVVLFAGFLVAGPGRPRPTPLPPNGRDNYGYSKSSRPCESPDPSMGATTTDI